MSPPAGVVPNFHNSPNLDVYVALTITLCVAFATLAVLLRMYTKVFILRVLAWEDCEFNLTPLSCEISNLSLTVTAQMSLS